MPIESHIDPSLWEPLPGVPNAAGDYRGYAMASARDVVYISGGKSKSVHRSFMSYDMVARKWTILPDMIHHRMGHRLAVIEGGRYLFAIGGWGCKSKSGGVDGKKKTSMIKTSFNKAVEPQNELEFKILGSYEVYDVLKKQWSEGGVLNDPRRDFAISVDSTCGRVYVFGVAPLPRSVRSCHALHVCNLIHIFEAGKKTLTYNIAEDCWSDDSPDDSVIPRCPQRGNVYSSSGTCSDGDVLVYSYLAEEADGRLGIRWMVVHIAKKRSKSWTVLPPVDGFAYSRTAVANGKLVLARDNALLAFQLVDDSIDDTSHTAGSTVNDNESTLSSIPSSSGRLIAEPIKAGKWKLQPGIASQPRDFRGYAVASSGNHVYISGGFSGDGTVHRSLLSYDIKKKKWKQLPSMTHHRLGHRMVVSGDNIYVLGGGDGKSLKSLGIEVYNIKKKTWTSGPSMNSYRVFFGCTSVLGMLIVLGGVGSNNGSELGLVELYDADTNSWRYGKPMPEVRGVCNIIVVGHTIYVFGTPSQKVLAYDVVAGEWLQDVSLEGLPLIPPGGCICASSSFASGEIIVTKYPFGDKQRRTAHVYNAAKKSWASVHLDDAFACYSAVVASDKIVVVTPQNHLMACTVPKSSG